METLKDFKEKLLDYILRQKEYETLDIEANKKLSREEKIEEGLLIDKAVVTKALDRTFEIKTENDNTKLRTGDSIKITVGKRKSNAKVLDISLDSLVISTECKLVEGDIISIEIFECVLLDPMINLLETMDEGKPGAYFLKQLAGIDAPKTKGLGAINADLVDTIPDSLNEKQEKVVRDVLKRPSVYCIQGPPGTGKTAVLATIAHTFAVESKEVLVISNTHQAVNNALNKIAEKEDGLSIVKIGEELRSTGLNACIVKSETYNDYIKLRKETKKKRVYADIVGMTLHAAVINLGLRNAGFQPSIVLVDEAGQIPMVYASLIGTFGGGSIIFIGDDKQMPPIYHQKLLSHEFSCSIFEYLCNKYPDMRNTLNVTYRMNDEITEFVNNNFYGCNGESQKIISSDYSKDRRLALKTDCKDVFERILSSNESIIICDPAENETDDIKSTLTEANPFEATFAVRLLVYACLFGVKASDMAVITPYRKQVKLLQALLNECYEGEDKPLANTVECLQGQDVELIIISFTSADESHAKRFADFILDSHRLNVMVSRAKTKVVLLASEAVRRELNKRYVMSAIKIN